jgi:hypothetical protein
VAGACPGEQHECDRRCGSPLALVVFAGGVALGAN